LVPGKMIKLTPEGRLRGGRRHEGESLTISRANSIAARQGARTKGFRRQSDQTDKWHLTASKISERVTGGAGYTVGAWTGGGEKFSGASGKGMHVVCRQRRGSQMYSNTMREPGKGKRFSNSGRRKERYLEEGGRPYQILDTNQEIPLGNNKGRCPLRGKSGNRKHAAASGTVWRRPDSRKEPSTVIEKYPTRGPSVRRSS